MLFENEEYFWEEITIGIISVFQMGQWTTYWQVNSEIHKKRRVKKQKFTFLDVL